MTKSNVTPSTTSNTTEQALSSKAPFTQNHDILSSKAHPTTSKKDNTMINLNAANELLLSEYASLKVRADSLQACKTLEDEAEYLYLRGIIGNSDDKGGVFFPQMATQLTGYCIDKIADVIEEKEILVYPQKAMKHEQSLNASLKMVACHSALLSGFTDVKTVTTALEGWLLEDSINEELDCEELALDLITEMINAGILNAETGKAITDTGAHYEAHGVTAELNTLRINTMRNLWDRAQPRMQPMRHKITWIKDTKGNAICEIKNLKLMKGKSIVSQDFIDAANKQSQVGYVINTAIRADLELWLESGDMPEMPEDVTAAMKAIDKHEDKVSIITALTMLPIDTIMYFPHTADWRGRFYARGGLTQFQSIKACKAIFDFAEYATPTDPTGLYLHIANAHGMDKVSIYKRLQWVKDNEKEIINGELATNIYAKRSALALAEYRATGQTNVICHLDGTCNGTQWTASLFRDEKTAKLVNVLASDITDAPFDLYGVIADRAIKLSTGTEKDLLIKYHRDLTKLPIMVLGYGASEAAIVRDVEEYLSEKGEKANVKKLVKSILTAIKLNAPAVTRLTTNLKRILKETPRNSIEWKAFDLTVKTTQTNTEHLNLQGTSYTAKMKGTALNDDLALARGISPNYIHSLDSAHLREVIRQSDSGLSCIHDSVGCPADKVLETNEIIRTAFHKLNQHDLVENIYNALNAKYTPQQGKLDIDEVLEAVYLFS